LLIPFVAVMLDLVELDPSFFHLCWVKQPLRVTLCLSRIVAVVSPKLQMVFRVIFVPLLIFDVGGVEEHGADWQVEVGVRLVGVVGGFEVGGELPAAKVRAMETRAAFRTTAETIEMLAEIGLVVA